MIVASRHQAPRRLSLPMAAAVSSKAATCRGTPGAAPRTCLRTRACRSIALEFGGGGVGLGAGVSTRRSSSVWGSAAGPAILGPGSRHVATLRETGSAGQARRDARPATAKDVRREGLVCRPGWSREDTAAGVTALQVVGAGFGAAPSTPATGVKPRRGPLARPGGPRRWCPGRSGPSLAAPRPAPRPRLAWIPSRNRFLVRAQDLHASTVRPRALVPPGRRVVI